jgi:mannose-6-phosphate isomerase-like protein (cupin superfamily)
VEAWQTATVGTTPDTLAPDGSEIRLLIQLSGASAVQCTLPVGGVTRAVCHRTVAEIWFFLSGRGEVWRKADGREETTQVEPGMALSIPLGTDFQFRTLGNAALTFVITTVPPWPGADEAVPVVGPWHPTIADSECTVTC